MQYRVLYVALILGLTGCEQQAPVPTPAARPVHPRDFFPTAVGSRWEYEVEVTGDSPPLLHHEIIKPIGGGQFGMVASRSVPLAFRDAPATPGKYRLVISVKGPSAATSGGIEVSVDVDDLGLFADAQQFVWGIDEEGRYVAMQVTTHEADGKATRVIFCAGQPGDKLMGKGSLDALHIEGVSENAPGLEGQKCPHFVRRVEPAPAGTPDDLSPAFTEDTWFARGQGLVRLEQWIGGKPTMVWRLVEFTPGAE